MDWKNGKSYMVLGLGIGIVFTNILSYLNPRIEYRELTDGEIIEMAEGLGMVSLKDKIKLDTKEGPKGKESSPIGEAEDLGVEPFNLEIEEGDNLSDIAEKLEEESLIDNREKFKARVKERELSKAIRYGSYKIDKDANFDEIINIITWKNKR